MARLMPLKFPGKCRKCGTVVPSGTAAYYDRGAGKGQHVTCMACAAPRETDPAPLEQPQPRNYAKVRIEQYDSLSAWSASAWVGGDANAATLKGQTELRRDGASWWGPSCPDYAAACKAASGHYPDGADIVASMARQTAAGARTIKRRRTRADMGSAVDMGMVWAGQLDRAWETTTRTAAAAVRTATLVAHIGASVATRGDEMFWRAAAVLACADALTEAGYSVQIDGAYCGRAILASDRDSRLALRVTVKRADAPMDIEALAGALSPAAFRTLGFRTVCNDPRGIVEPSLGYPDHDRDALIAAWPDLETAYIVPGDAMNKDKAEAWVAATIAAIEGNSL